ncbi:MAG: hypothetical protein MR688_02235 [Prevotella sp.]|nr:hypothetical protein [Prevotella sp.]
MVSTIVSYVSIAASFAVAFYFYKFQKKYYDENMSKLEKARDFFLANPTYSVVSKGEDKAIDVSNINGELLNLVKELNKYMSRNKGTTDFSIIQNKTERFANTIFENASSNLAFPTYMGLMGTFTGVFMGLLGFALPDLLELFGMHIESPEESNITRLILGVIVSMVTSFMGLYFTTRSNKVATDYKRIMDERKNIFYDFIQNELMPVLGMSVVAALTQLKETLTHFHESFDVITNNFERTFNNCTSKFGKEFEKNIVAVGNAASQLGTSIEDVNKNVENQQNLLKELRSDGMIMALDRFIDAGKQFQNSTEAIKDLDSIRTELSSAVTNLIKTQKDYNSTLVVPKLIAERLNVILERVTTFEESVNVLGASIAQTHMLGNSEITLIKEHLDNIKRKDAIALEYQETANEELKALFDAETNIIKDLHRQYTSAIEEHGDEFRVLMEQVADAITQKKIEFMQILQNAFDVAELHTEFAHLKQLPEINEKIGSLNDSVDCFRNSVQENSEAEKKKLDFIDEKLDAIPSVVNEMDERCKNHTDVVLAAIGDVKTATNGISSSIDRVKELTEVIVADSNNNKDELANRINILGEKLSIMKNDLDTIKDHARLTVNLNKDEMLDVVKAIKLQQEEVGLLDTMLSNTKQEMSDSFVKVFKMQLDEISKKIENVGSHVEGLKAKIRKDKNN